MILKEHNSATASKQKLAFIKGLISVVHEKDTTYKSTVSHVDQIHEYIYNDKPQTQQK